ncbi:MAG TPA: FAD:protein FMN transferase [Pirellulaceae bacterium]|jgi:thiamine biosynthesis lipoprotein|nr:FAD:protein FMN transferase [Pirellulaceae bacterium]
MLFGLRSRPFAAAVASTRAAPFIVVAMGLVSLGALVGCEGPSKPEPVVLSGLTMGTTFETKFFGVETDEAIGAIGEAIEAELEEVNRQMSTYLPESEISRFNRSDSTDWFAVSGETEQVVRRSLEIAAESEGAFDPTVMPLVRLWKFGPDKEKQPEFPSEEAIAAAKSHVGHELVTTRIDPPALRKSDPQVEVDLSAVAKGHGVDRVGAVLRRAGVDSWYVEIGGEVLTSGAKPDGSPWILGIEAPSPQGRSAGTFVRVVGEALATSGDYRNFYEVDGVRYSHTIDPVTGRPVVASLASVSVLAKNCADADGYATALSVLGEERGMRLAESAGIEAMLLLREGAALRTRTTPGFEERVIGP